MQPGAGPRLRRGEAGLGPCARAACPASTRPAAASAPHATSPARARRPHPAHLLAQEVVRVLHLLEAGLAAHAQAAVRVALLEAGEHLHRLLHRLALRHVHPAAAHLAAAGRARCARRAHAPPAAAHRRRLPLRAPGGPAW